MLCIALSNRDSSTQYLYTMTLTAVVLPDSVASIFTNFDFCLLILLIWYNWMGSFHPMVIKSLSILHVSFEIFGFRNDFYDFWFFLSIHTFLFILLHPFSFWIYISFSLYCIPGYFIFFFCNMSLYLYLLLFFFYWVLVLDSFQTFIIHLVWKNLILNQKLGTP